MQNKNIGSYEIIRIFIFLIKIINLTFLLILSQSIDKKVGIISKQVFPLYR